jgi:hypothetical protein
VREREREREREKERERERERARDSGHHLQGRSGNFGSRQPKVRIVGTDVANANSRRRFSSYVGGRLFISPRFSLHVA